MPNPNDPESPETITILDEDGTPLGKFTKKKTSSGEVIYVDENGIPLGKTRVPKTGDDFSAIPYLSLLGVSLSLMLFLKKVGKE